MSAPLTDFIKKHAESDPVSYHMPGHKGTRLYKKYGYDHFLSNMMDYDITELYGADNLYQSEGILKEAQENYAKLYGVKRSYFLINGSSGGLIAAVLASVPKGRKLIMARNCHKSIYNALILGGIDPVYAYPEIIDEYGISGEITPEEIEDLIIKNPEASAVILPSPNYYGICSRIRDIAEVVHRHGLVLIVDQAHGAHLKFFSDTGYDLPASAEESGADIIVGSSHKTLASFTQTAILNLNSDRVDHYVLEDKLQMIESTSPSYILMSSLEISCRIIGEHKKEVIGEWHDAVMHFYREALKIKGLRVMGNPAGSGAGINLDYTKINLDMSAYGINGAELEQMLLKYNIFAELYTGNILMCMTGIGTSLRDTDRLLAALREIAAENEDKFDESAGAARPKADPAVYERAVLYAIPVDKERVPLKESAGRICASSIIPYPPGIPLVCPGEMITENAVRYVEKLRADGEKVIGLNDAGEVTVGRK